MSSIARALIQRPRTRPESSNSPAVFARSGSRILSTGGTAGRLGDAGVPVVEVSSFTGFPEMMDGRVKTLHPRIHGGLLARRDTDAKAMREHGIAGIDLLGGQPLSVRGDGGAARLRPRHRRREHRRRRPGDAARGGEEPRMGGGRGRRARLRRGARRAARGRNRRPGHALPARGQGVRAHRALRRCDRELSRGAGRHRPRPRRRSPAP